MVNAREVYERYMNAGNAPYKTKLTIKSVDELEQPDHKDKLVLSFNEDKRLLPLNVTNANILIDGIGEDTKDWIGLVICLKKGKTQFQGKTVDTIVIVNPQEMV